MNTTASQTGRKSVFGEQVKENRSNEDIIKDLEGLLNN